MATIGRLWAGRIFGTNTGNVALELNPTNEGLQGTARIMDDRLGGPSVYNVNGKFEDGKLSIHAEPAIVPENQLMGVVTASAKLLENGSLRGEWSSTIGTGGALELFPHDPPDASVSGAPKLQEQLYVTTRTLGAIRLHRSDIPDLIDFLKTDFTVGRPIVTYAPRGTNITLFADDFLARNLKSEKLRYLKIHVQEPEGRGHSINKIVSVEFYADGINVVRAEGANESWVIGRSEALARYLKQFEKSFVTNFKKWGLGFNQLLLLVAIIAMPNLGSFWPRLGFVGGALVLTNAVGWFHTRLLPNALVYTEEKRPRGLAALWPSVLSWLLAMTASLAAALLFWLLTQQQ